MRYLLLFLATMIACTSQKDRQLLAIPGGHYLDLFSTKIYYEEVGEGIPLLLLQGGGIERSGKDFAASIPGLAKHYRVIIPDTPGQGKSELADSLSYQLLTDYTSALIDSLKLDSAYVMGFSDGGIVALLLAEKRPDKVRKVIAVGANNGIRGMLPPGVDPGLVSPDPIDEKWERENKAVIDAYQALKARDWRKLINDQNRMWYQLEYFSNDILESISVPVMIVQGDHDVIRLEHAVELHRLIKNSQLFILPNTPHDVFAEKPGIMNDVAIDFFEAP
jgi:pimeloyl-ACP methyl ester carboxylesterase